MSKIVFLFSCFFVFLFIGAGCKSDVVSVLDSSKVKPILEMTAERLTWSGGVIVKNPSEENNYGKAYILNGPSREGRDRLSVDFSSLEILEYTTNEVARWNFFNDECFKGKGKPIEINGVSACCLNDVEDGWNSAVMLSGQYILRAIDYFHSDCYAKKYLEEFWKVHREL
ncbi:hypothetical protein L6259_02570 [Candidatus Parcubacteria bacterium]|nr:hypothetical protein [Patescibacteria group bacterium]MCG2694130.1 hypothetical protein [Candidatus Parcubacteria bacterium]